jgi:S1-C subfamily serine protease
MSQMGSPEASQIFARSQSQFSPEFGNSEGQTAALNYASAWQGTSWDHQGQPTAQSVIQESNGSGNSNDSASDKGTDDHSEHHRQHRSTGSGNQSDTANDSSAAGGSGKCDKSKGNNGETNTNNSDVTASTSPANSETAGTSSESNLGQTNTSSNQTDATATTASGSTAETGTGSGESASENTGTSSSSSTGGSSLDQLIQMLQQYAPEIAQDVQNILTDLQDIENDLTGGSSGSSVAGDTGATTAAGGGTTGSETAGTTSGETGTGTATTGSETGGTTSAETGTGTGTTAETGGTTSAETGTSGSTSTSGLTQAENASVQVTVNNGNGEETLGSGFFADGNGDIVTDYHVVQGAQGPITITTADGQTLQAKVVETDQANDLAVLQLTDSSQDANQSYIQVADNAQPSATDYAIGHPDGATNLSVDSGNYTGQATYGSLGVDDDSVDNNQNRQLDQFANIGVQEGSSGSDIVNNSGQLVAVDDVGDGEGNADGTLASAVYNDLASLNA